MKHADRYREIVGVLADEGLGSVADQLGLTRFGTLRTAVRRVSPESASDVPVEVRTRHTLERLGPTFVKVGQALSTRPDLIPESFATELAKLQDECRPIPFAEARMVIEEELGAPIEEVFLSFDEEPVAAASIGQVYAAILPSGEAVAVKVQRPNIKSQVDTDLDIMLTQARFLADHTDIGLRYNVAAIGDEFARAVRGELDYIGEARNAERLAEMFRDDDSVVFPKVYWNLTTPRVLTLELLVGIPMNRPHLITEAGLDRGLYARRGVYCYLEQIFNFGLYHADPHPGNLFALPDGRVGFTDFGRVGTLSDRSREYMADLFVAIVDRDDRAAVDVLMTASRSGPEVDVAKLQIEISRLISKYYNLALRDVHMKELLTEVMNLIRINGLKLPSEFAVLLSTLAVLEGVGQQLDPDFDFVAVTAPIARRIVTERNSPQNLARSFARSLRASSRALTDLPDALQRFVATIASGDMQMTVRAAGYEPLLMRLEALVNRLAFAVVLAAFVLGLAYMLAQHSEIPEWFLWLARVAFLVAAITGTWFFVSIFVSRYRAKR